MKLYGKEQKVLSMKKKTILLLLLVIVGIAVGILIVPRITLLIRSYVELQPLLERARTVLDGTANPASSKELDGELYSWSWDRERNLYPEAVQIEVSPIKIQAAVPDGNGGIILTVNFEITRYRIDGKVDSWISCAGDKWYVRKNDDRWIVYKIETTP